MFTKNTFNTGFFTVPDEKNKRYKKAVAYLHGIFKASKMSSASDYSFIVLGETDKAYNIAIINVKVGSEYFIKQIRHHDRSILCATFDWIPKSWLDISQCTMNAWIDIPIEDLPSYWMEFAP